MILEFKHTYEDTNGGSRRCIIVEQVRGVVSVMVYQEKVFEAIDQTNDDIIFGLSDGQRYNLSKMTNVKVVVADVGNEKVYEVTRNEVTHLWEMGGTSYDTIKELYDDLSALWMNGVLKETV